MNFLNIYNWLKLNTTLPSFLFKNRFFVPYIKNIKKIFNLLGFTYKNNSWYIEKFNNILNLVTITKLVNSVAIILGFILLVSILDLRRDFVFMEFIGVIDTIELITSGMIFCIYWVMLFIKFKIISIFTKKDTKYTSYSNEVLDLTRLNTLNMNFFDTSTPSDISKLFDNFNVLSFIKLYNKLYNCIYVSTNVNTSTTKLEYFLLIQQKSLNLMNYKTMTNISNFIISNNQYLQYNLKTNKKTYINADIYSFIKSIKYTKWLFNYFGSNKNNYSYLYNLNNKFNYFYNSSLLSISNTFTNAFTNLIDKEVTEIKYNFNENSALKTTNSSKLFSLYTLNNGFNVFNNFFISNKFSLYSNFLNNNITQQSDLNNKRQYIQHLELFTNFTELSNKNSIKTDLFNSINFINFKYYTYNITTVSIVDNSKIKKLFFFK